MKIATNKDIEQIKELYVKLNSYAAVARATGFSPLTIKKYVNEDIEKDKSIIHFNKKIPEFDESIYTNNFEDICSLTEEEILSIKELWKELDN